MPTNKKTLTLYMQEADLQKMRYIAKHETRALSNLLEHMCRLYIQQFEAEHGAIQHKKASP